MNPIPIPPGMETRLFLLEADALSQLPEAIHSLWGSQARPWLVADDNTWAAAGARVAEILRSAGLDGPAPFRFPGSPMLHADESNVNLLLEAFPENVVPVAIGGGTVNDLVKRASGVRHVSYCCVPTAPSVDGYTSSGAALTVAGLKQTLPCPAPLAVIADSGILRAAPSEMFAAGYADLMAKIPAGADWIAADTLGIEAIDPAVWALVQTPLRDNLSDPADVRRVFTGLAATGYAMQLYRDSRPASGADHLVSHIWEMENLCCDGKPVSHGFKVAIGTVISTALYEALFSLSEQEARQLARPGLNRAGREAEIDALLSVGSYGAAARTIALDKFREGRSLAERRELIYHNWEKLRQRILHQLYPLQELTARLAAARCPVKPADIRLGREQFLHGIRTAQLIRKRYTVLDLAYELGLMEELLKRILPVMKFQAPQKNLRHHLKFRFCHAILLKFKEEKEKSRDETDTRSRGIAFHFPPEKGDCFGMIKATDVQKRFGAITAVDRVSFSVEKGEVLGFLGPNGAGKSTTMRMITGFLPLSSGRITIGDCDIEEDPVGAKRLFGYLPENAPAYQDMSVTGFLNFAAAVRGLSGKAKADAVARAVKICHLENVTHQTIDTLSKGYRHRVCFAQAILHDPPVLILDEPTDGLDPNQKHEMRELIREMGKNKAIIVSTHILEEVEAICTRVIIIDRGHLVFNGTPRELLERAPRETRLSLILTGVSGADAVAALKKLPAATAVEVRDETTGRTRLELRSSAPADEFAAEVKKFLDEHRWNFIELHAEPGKLDEVFRALTTPDSPAGKEAK